MSDVLDVEFISPLSSMSIDGVYCVTLRTLVGSIGIMPDHIPLFSEISSGIVEIAFLNNSKVSKFFVYSGFVMFMDNVCSIRTYNFLDLASFDKVKLKAIKDEADETIKDSSALEYLKKSARKKLDMCNILSEFFN